MNQRLSHSATNCYTQCGRKYQLRYIHKLKSKLTSGALLFGSAIDNALNSLLETKDLSVATKAFDKAFRFNFINNKGYYLPECKLITYAKTDFDLDLLKEEDLKWFNDRQYELNTLTNNSISEVVAILQDKKATSGYNSLSEDEKELLNLANWLCLYRKGIVMLRAYSEQVLPKIKQVLAVQKSIEIENNDGDKLIGFIDLIVETADGKRYVLDNKTSSVQYDANSPQRSQQLILYYHITKEEYKLDGVGFVVMYKHILKNKKKTCSKCSNDGTGKRHKTCDVETEFGRCNGTWDEVLNPDARIEFITNSVPEAAENLVMETFDEANNGIKNKMFGPNLQACHTGNIYCDYYQYCWTGSKEDLVQTE